MLKIALLSITCLISCHCLSQDYFTVSEKSISYTAPIFPGGSDAFLKIFTRNFKIPATVNKITYEGTFKIHFTVDTLGTTILDSIGFDKMNAARKKVSPSQLLQAREEIIEEVTRVFDRLPEWLPAKSDGRSVPNQFNWPYRIDFDH